MTHNLVIDEETIRQLCKSYNLMIQFQFYGDECLVRICHKDWQFAITSNSFANSLYSAIEYFKTNRLKV